MRDDVTRLLEIFERAGVLPHEELGVEGARAATEASVRLQSPKIDLPLIEDRKIPTPVGPLRARVYWPQTAEPAPLLIYLHGGGWCLGSLDTADGPCRDLARGTGRIVVSVDFRLAPEHRFPAAFDDAVNATEWLLAHADELGGLKSDLALMGDSAGGNLAAATVAHLVDQDKPRPDHLVLVYPSLAMPNAHRFPSYRENSEAPIVSSHTMRWFWEHYLPSPAPKPGDVRAEPLTTARADRFPRTFVATAELDPLRDEGLAFAKLLANAGVEVQAEHFAGAVHGFWWLGGLLEQAAELTESIAEFLR